MCTHLRAAPPPCCTHSAGTALTMGTAAAPHAAHTLHMRVGGGDTNHTHTTPPNHTAGLGALVGLPASTPVPGHGRAPWCWEAWGGAQHPRCCNPRGSRGWAPPRTSPARCWLTPLGWGHRVPRSARQRGAACLCSPPRPSTWWGAGSAWRAVGFALWGAGLAFWGAGFAFWGAGFALTPALPGDPMHRTSRQRRAQHGGSPGGTPAWELPCVGSLSTLCPLCSAPRVPPAGAGVPACAGLPAPLLQRQALRPGRPPRAAQHPGRTAARAWHVHGMQYVHGVCMACAWCVLGVCMACGVCLVCVQCLWHLHGTCTARSTCMGCAWHTCFRGAGALRIAPAAFICVLLGGGGSTTTP